MRLALGGIAAVLASVGWPAAAQSPASAIDLFVRADKGHCIACHQLPAGVGPATRSDLGPALNGERMRALGRKAIAQVLEDPQALNAETVMPPFGKHRILDAAEIARIAEFLHALP